MGMFDKAKDMAAEHPDAVDQGIDKGADFADEKTGGEHGEQIDKGADFAQDKADDFLGGDDRSEGPGEGGSEGGGEAEDGNR